MPASAWTELLNNLPALVPLGNGVQAEVLQWAYAAHLPDNVPHRHTFFEVCQVGAYGEGRFLVEGETYALHPGTVFFARPGIVHQIVNDAEPLMELFWVAFRWKEMGAGRGEIGALTQAFAQASDRGVAADQEGRVAALWQTLRLLSATEQPLMGAPAQITAVMSALLLAIAQAGSGYPRERSPRHEIRNPHRALARAAISYIDDNLNRPLPVAEIAAHVGLSPRHLTRLLTDLAGVAPAAYVERARMDRARGLLLRTGEPIKSVATQVGYLDVHHFTRVFTRSFGCSPGRFRQRDGRLKESLPSDALTRGGIVQKPGALV